MIRTLKNLKEGLKMDFRLKFLEKKFLNSLFFVIFVLNLYSMFSLFYCLPKIQSSRKCHGLFSDQNFNKHFSELEMSRMLAQEPFD